MVVTELLLPRTSDAMTEAVVSAWLVPSESEVSQGDLLAEVETDKAIVEVVAEMDGLLVAAVAEGSTVQVGGVLAYFLDGEEIAEYREGRLSLASTSSALRVDSDKTVAGPRAGVAEVIQPNPTDALEPALSPGSGAPVDTEVRSGVDSRLVFSSPLARRLARERGLLLEDLYPGSGPNGRIVREDVLRRERRTLPERRAPMGTRHRSMVSAMVTSKTEIPHFYLFRDIDLGSVLSYRHALVAAQLPAPSVSAILIKALGVVLVENEFARRRWIQGQVENSNDANIGIAVADGIDEIVVPVVQAPALRSLEGVAEELARLGEAVRSRALRREDMMDAVATISNLGMFGVDALLPIIPPSQSFILGVGRDRKEVFLDELGRAMSRTVATFSLAGDHRVLTGLGGARILERLDQLVQHPLLLASVGTTAASGT